MWHYLNHSNSTQWRYHSQSILRA